MVTANILTTLKNYQVALNEKNFNNWFDRFYWIQFIKRTLL